MENWKYRRDGLWLCGSTEAEVSQEVLALVVKGQPGPTMGDSDANEGDGDVSGYDGGGNADDNCEEGYC